MLIPLVLLIGVGYMLLVRPQRARTRQAQSMRSTLGVGAEVQTVGGLYATVVEMDGSDVVLELAPGVRTRWAAAAVGRVITPVELPAEDASAQSGDEPTEPPAAPETDDPDR